MKRLLVYFFMLTLIFNRHNCLSMEGGKSTLSMDETFLLHVLQCFAKGCMEKDVTLKNCDFLLVRVKEINQPQVLAVLSIKNFGSAQPSIDYYTCSNLIIEKDALLQNDNDILEKDLNQIYLNGKEKNTDPLGVIYTCCFSYHNSDQFLSCSKKNPQIQKLIRIIKLLSTNFQTKLSDNNALDQRMVPLMSDALADFIPLLLNDYARPLLSKLLTSCRAPTDYYSNKPYLRRGDTIEFCGLCKIQGDLNYIVEHACIIEQFGTPQQKIRIFTRTERMYLLSLQGNYIYPMGKKDHPVQHWIKRLKQTSDVKVNLGSLVPYLKISPEDSAFNYEKSSSFIELKNIKEHSCVVDLATLCQDVTKSSNYDS